MKIRQYIDSISELNFTRTRDGALYKNYWEGPNHLRNGNWSARNLPNNKYFDMERWWNQSGYMLPENLQDSYFNTPKLKDFIKNSSIVDLGCGKGFSLFCFMLGWEFKNYVGLEINEDYLNIFKSNFNVLKEKRHEFREKSLQLYHMNVVDYEFSKSDNFLYIFNSFGRETWKKIMPNLMKSLEEHPRELYICYDNSAHADQIVDNYNFELVYGSYENKKILLKYSGQ